MSSLIFAYLGKSFHSPSRVSEIYSESLHFENNFLFYKFTKDDTVMQIEKALINDRLRVTKVS